MKTLLKEGYRNFFYYFIGLVGIVQGDFFHWYPPKKLKYGKPGLGESTLT